MSERVQEQWIGSISWPQEKEALLCVVLHIQVSAGDEPRISGAEIPCMAGAEMSCMAGADVSHMAGDGDVLYGCRG